VDHIAQSDFAGWSCWLNAEARQKAAEPRPARPLMGKVIDMLRDETAPKSALQPLRARGPATCFHPAIRRFGGLPARFKPLTHSQ
jgi:hypothetical protein